MSWFDEQVRQRKQGDDDAFTDSFVDIAGAVMGRRLSHALNDDRLVTKSAVEEILKYYRLKPKPIPDSITEMNEQIEYLMRPHGIMRRTVTLTSGWHKDAIGAMLGVLKEGETVVALLPHGMSGYCYVDPSSKLTVRINSGNEHLFEEEAIAFYKPLPLEPIGVADLFKYMVSTLSFADIALLIVTTFVASLLGLFLPLLTRFLFDDVVGSGSVSLLLSVSVFLICITVSTLLIETIKQLFTARCGTKLGISVQAATMMRLLSLPTGFFKEYSAGELSSRMAYMKLFCDTLISIIFITGISSLFSLVYIVQIASLAPQLALPAVVILLSSLILSIVSAVIGTKINKRQMELSSKESGMSYALISGVQKIKLSGAEKRAFARWGELFAKGARLRYNPPLFIKINSVLALGITLIGNIVIYIVAAEAQIGVADYYAFQSAYGMVGAAFASLAGIALSVATIKPMLEMVAPILNTSPEISQGKKVITKLGGSIELSNISFRYSDTMPLVLDDLSLKIRPGQYVAIVGRTGCGKSTLMRLLLGFETPNKGSIYYDGKDMNNIDLKSLRRRIGVVLQSGKLFSNDIFSNITICAPWLTLDEAWEAAELAGISEDIRRMPMGMHTMVSEGGGGISGGQKQRLMIARAIAPKPKVLMFDEATSALDNRTQKKVSASLDNLRCTRVVIAHRLSTIKQCDRIIVLENGKIVEDGTYEQLIERPGFFKELVERQRLDA